MAPKERGSAFAAFIAQPCRQRGVVENTPALLSATQLGTLSNGAAVCVTAGDAGARFLLVAAKPLNEPIARYGPFVMNTRHEIEQAVADYNAGRF